MSARRTYWFLMAAMCLLAVLSWPVTAQMGMGMGEVPGMTRPKDKPARVQPRIPQNPTDLVSALDKSPGVPIPGIIHVHSRYSDGLNAVLDLALAARGNGAKYLVICDHLENIESDSASLLQNIDLVGQLFNLFRGESSKLSGIDNYVEDCWQASRLTGVLVVPGFEVGIGTKFDNVRDVSNGQINGNLIHMLAFGVTDSTAIREVSRYLGLEKGRTYSQEEKSNSLQEAQRYVSSVLSDEGMAVIIAHPFMNPDPTHGYHYTYYKNETKNIHGIEFFNENPTSPELFDAKSLEAMGFTNRDVLQDDYSSKSFIAGSDYHGFPSAEVSKFGKLSIENPFSKQTIFFIRDGQLWPNRYQPNQQTMMYRNLCGLVAGAFRSDATTLIACDRQYDDIITSGGQAQMMQALGRIGIYAGGQKFTLVQAVQNKIPKGGVGYLHIPGVIIARAMTDGTTYPMDMGQTYPRLVRLGSVAP